MVDQGIQSDSFSHSNTIRSIDDNHDENKITKSIAKKHDLAQDRKEAEVESFAATEAVSNPSSTRAVIHYPIHLLEFKAGRMDVHDKHVKPDLRHGMIYLFTDIRQHIHFCWKDRHSVNPELDIITDPGHLEFKRVDSCKTGRIYVLKYRKAVNRYFFWMQDPHHELDTIICARVNELLLSGKTLVEYRIESRRK